VIDFRNAGVIEKLRVPLQICVHLRPKNLWNFLSFNDLIVFFFVLFQICVHLRSSAAKNSLEFLISPSFDKFGAFSHVFKCEPKRIDPEKFSFSLKFSTA